jgi:hypothetical protein
LYRLLKDFVQSGALHQYVFRFFTRLDSSLGAWICIAPAFEVAAAGTIAGHLSLPGVAMCGPGGGRARACKAQLSISTAMLGCEQVRSWRRRSSPRCETAAELYIIISNARFVTLERDLGACR